MLTDVSRIEAEPDAADDVDITAFRDLVMHLLGEKRPDLAVEPRDTPDVITVEGRPLPLDNLLIEALEVAPEEIDDLILWFVDAHLSSAADADRIANATFSEVRDNIMIQLVALSEDPADLPSDLIIPFARSTGLAFVIDTEAGMIYIDRPRVADWDVTLMQVHEAAMANMEQRAKATRIDFVTPEYESFQIATVSTGDGYDAARLLSPALHARLKSRLGPRIFIGAPNRDFLVAWPDLCAPATKMHLAASVAEDAAYQPYPKTADLFVLTPDGLREASAADYRAHGRNESAA